MRPSSVGALSIKYPRKRAQINGGNVTVLGATADSRVRHLLYASSQRVAGEYGEGGKAVIADGEAFETFDREGFESSLP